MRQQFQRRLLLGKKIMTNLDSILKNRDVTLPAKVCLVKAMVFPVVMYGCESWTIKKDAAAAAAAKVVSVVSDSMRPHRRQPSMLPRPWDSPGNKTGVGCHFLLQRMKVKSGSELAQSCPTLSNPMDCSLRPQDFPGKSTGVGCHCLLWGQFYLASNPSFGCTNCPHLSKL